MAQVSQGALDASITPEAVLRGHSQDQFPYLLACARPARCSAAAAVVLSGNQALVPLQEGAWRGDRAKGSEPVRADSFGLGRQSASPVIIKAGPLAPLFPEYFDFLLEVLNGALLVTVNPVCQAEEQKL